MRRLIGFIFQIIVLVVCIFALSAAWIIIDGLVDSGHQKADVALVFDHNATGAQLGKPALDRVVELYKAGDFPYVIVSATSQGDIGGDASAMTAYLVERGLPSSAILIDGQGNTTLDTAHHTARLMQEHQFHSVLVIAKYYQMTRTNLALTHEKVEQVQKNHVGALDKNDALPIGREVVALYDYLGKYYFMPTAKKVEAQAQVDLEKAKVEAQAEADKAKQTVDQQLNSATK